MKHFKTEYVKETVVVYLIKDNKVLLMLRNKKENDLNKDKWIGVGGHIEENETPMDAVIREVKEETNYNILSAYQKAAVYFNYDGSLEYMHVFISNSFTGRLSSSCDEGTLKWVPIKDMDKLEMWEGDKYFLKPIFEDKPYFELFLKYEKGLLKVHQIIENKE